MSDAAKLGDRVVAVDTHILLVPSPGGPVATPTPCPFDGKLVERLCRDVLIDNLPVATEESVALNVVPHIPTAGPFQRPPSNRGTVKSGCATVLAGGRKIARLGDTVETCNDPLDAPRGCVLATSTVKVG
ncbi:MAG: PAAR domain-containing protein [Polyangiaceae bacterium]